MNILNSIEYYIEFELNILNCIPLFERPPPFSLRGKDDSCSADPMDDYKVCQNGSLSYAHHIKSDPLQLNPEDYPQHSGVDDVAEDLSVAPESAVET